MLSRDQEAILGLETETETLAIRSRDRDRDLDKMNSSALESRDHGIEITALPGIISDTYWSLRSVPALVAGRLGLAIVPYGTGAPLRRTQAPPGPFEIF